MIMAGGGGTRFWPRSRPARPKQFLTLTGDRSLLQQACDRLEAQVPPERTWVITAEQHRAEAREATAAAAAGADRRRAVWARHRPVHRPGGRPDRPPRSRRRHARDAGRSRHRAGAEFRRAVRAAASVAAEHPDALITFGIPPTFPATGYGYIHRGAEVARRQGVPVFRVSAFREKPAADLAEQFVACGEYFWNSGIFVWKVAAILDELRTERNRSWSPPSSASPTPGTRRSGDEMLRAEYPRMEKISIDYAVMEHAREVLVVQAPYRWDDVGSWLALERMHPQDADGNTVLATHSGIKTTHCVIVGDDPKRVIATIGVSNLLIIQDGDATLVADRRDEGTVKQLVDLLKKQGLERYL